MVPAHRLECVELDPALARLKLGAVGLAVAAVNVVRFRQVLRVSHAHLPLAVQCILRRDARAALERHVVAARVFVPESHVAFHIEIGLRFMISTAGAGRSANQVNERCKAGGAEADEQDLALFLWSHYFPFLIIQ